MVVRQFCIFMVKSGLTEPRDEDHLGAVAHELLGNMVADLIISKEVVNAGLSV